MTWADDQLWDAYRHVWGDHPEPEDCIAEMRQVAQAPDLESAARVIDWWGSWLYDEKGRAARGGAHIPPAPRDRRRPGHLSDVRAGGGRGASGVRAEILWGDCLRVLPALESLAYDVAIADPPYMIGASSVAKAGKAGTMVDMFNASAWYAEWMRATATKLPRGQN